MKPLRVLVYGAPGAQGAAVAATLLSQGHHVRVIAPAGLDLLSLQHAGAERVVGDFDSYESLLRASEGMDAVSLVLPLHYDFERVTRQGRHALDAAAATGVRHLVFNTSTQYPSKPTGIPLHDIKIALQKTMLDHALPVTILRPTVYLENMLSPFAAPAIVNTGILAYPLPATHPVSWISWSDMAAYVASALARPQLAGSVLNIAGADTVRGSELAAIIGQAVGREMRYEILPTELFAAGLNRAIGAPAGDEIAKFYAWFASQPASSLAVDARAASEALQVQVTTIRDWASRQDWAKWRA